jgi:glycosyltransferase involved in cell wall biosynthesis
VIVGAGELEKEAEDAVAAAGGRVSWLGRRSGRELLDVVANARAVILTSMCFANALMAILEAHIPGKPVIGADIGGIPELVKEGKTGFLLRSGDAVGLGAATRRTRDLSAREVAGMGAGAPVRGRALHRRTLPRTHAGPVCVAGCRRGATRDIELTSLPRRRFP